MDLDLLYETAKIENLNRIIQIYNSVIPSRMVTADTVEVSMESRLDWFYQHNDRLPLWLVKQDSDIIGWISFQAFYGRPAYQKTVEISIYLDEKYRRKGIGRQVLHHCLKQCDVLKIKTLLAFIFAHNVPSIMLFESTGFKEWGHLQNVAEIDGQEISLKILGLRLQS